MDDKTSFPVGSNLTLRSPSRTSVRTTHADYNVLLPAQTGCQFPQAMSVKVRLSKLLSCPSGAMSETGVVKFFNSVDSYGFIRMRGPRGADKSSDVYVHRNAIADGQSLLRGDKVSFDAPQSQTSLLQ